MALKSNTIVDDNRGSRDQNPVLRNNQYWLPKEDGIEDGPFCCACHDRHHQFVRLTAAASVRVDASRTAGAREEDARLPGMLERSVRGQPTIAVGVGEIRGAVARDDRERHVVAGATMPVS